MLPLLFNRVNVTLEHNEWHFLLNHLALAFLLCLQTCLHATQQGVTELITKMQQQRFSCRDAAVLLQYHGRNCHKLLYFDKHFIFIGMIRWAGVVNAVKKDVIVPHWSACFSRCLCELKRAWWVSFAHCCSPVQPWADVSPPPPWSRSFPQELRRQTATGPRIPRQPGGEAVETRR